MSFQIIDGGPAAGSLIAAADSMLAYSDEPLSSQGYDQSLSFVGLANPSGVFHLAEVWKWVYNEFFGVTDILEKDYDGYLNYIPVRPGSVSATDGDQDANINFLNVNSGYLDISFDNFPAGGDNIQITYEYRKSLVYCVSFAFSDQGVSRTSLVSSPWTTWVSPSAVALNAMSAVTPGKLAIFDASFSGAQVHWAITKNSSGWFYISGNHA